MDVISDFRRSDYIQQAGRTYPKTTQLIGNVKTTTSTTDKGKGQKIVCGDSNGTLQCFRYRKEEVQFIFKTVSSHAIKRVVLGVRTGSAKCQRVFIATMREVQAFTKKGKRFLTMATNMLDPVQSICVLDAHLIVCSKFMMNHFKDCEEFHHFSCGEKIYDVLVLPAKNGDSIMPVIACQDRMLRIFKASELLYEAETPGKPLVMELFNQNGGHDGRHVVYGTSDGRIGKIHLGSSRPTPTWEIYSHKRRGAVLALDCFDIVGDGVRDLLVGRDDGQVEVYTFEDSDKPELKHNFTSNESITAVKGGNVAWHDFDEIVCTSYSGCVFSLSQKPAGPVVNQGFTKEGIAVIKKLKTEIEELQQMVAQERKKYLAAMEAKNAISALPLFALKEEFELDPSDASYALSLELESAIDSVILQSNVPLDVMDSATSAVVSFTPCKFEDGNFLLATYRCQANTLRIDLKVHTIEGQSGLLQAYVTPRVKPKMCRVVRFPIKPLSLHRRSHTFDDARPVSLLKLTGLFSTLDVHSWLSACLPEMPERYPADDSCHIQFSSVMLGTQLDCLYRKGYALFSSDNVSTISILKEAISRQAHQKRIRLELSFELNKACVPHTLRLIHPLLDHQLLLAKKVQLIDALMELQSCEEDLSFLADEYKDILDNREGLLAEFKSQPCRLERFYGLITDFFIDAFKLKGQNVKSKVPELMKILETGDLPALLLFFQQQ